MRWRNLRLIAGLGLAVTACASCEESTPHASVLLGTYQFTGSMDMMVDNCATANPTIDWTTTFTAQASEVPDHIWITEQSYGCSLLAPLDGSIADAGGLSCPVIPAGFFRQDFFLFRWDFAKKELKYSSVLYGQDANKAIIKYCASVRGSVAMQ